VVHSFDVVQGNTPPRILAPVAQTLAEDGVLEELAITLDDDETEAFALTLVARSDTPSLIDTDGLQLSGAGSTRRLRVAPRPDAFGSALVTLVVSDAGGLSTEAQFRVDVLSVNDAPTLSIANARIVHAPSGPVAHAMPSFADATPGPANEAAQSLAFDLSVLSDPQAILDSASIGASGGLSHALSGQSGVALLRLTVTDSGGASNGGIDQAHRDFHIVVTAGADVVLRVLRVAPFPRSTGPAASMPVSAVEYAVEAINHGPSALAETRLSIGSSAALGSLLWVCNPAAACAPASGSHAGAGPHSLSTALALGAGQSTVLTLSGELDPSANWLELSAEALMPPALRPAGGNPRVVLIEAISGEAAFRDGFE